MPKPSLRQAIDAMCGQCRGGDIFIIANCDRYNCPLHPVRPNQVLAGRLPAQYSEEQVLQETLDALEFSGLREWEKLHVPRRD